jgi:hypothetical protein
MVQDEEKCELVTHGIQKDLCLIIISQILNGFSIRIRISS